MKAIFLTLIFALIGSQSVLAGGHCNTAIANEDIDKVYMSHETKEPISHHACMQNLSHALKMASKLCMNKKLPHASVATISATYYSQDGNLSELISEGFYKCDHNKVNKIIKKLAKKKHAKKLRRSIASRR